MIKKFTLLLLAMLCIAGTLKAATIWEGTVVTENWGGTEGKFVNVANTSFSELSTEKKYVLKITLSEDTSTATYWQFNLKNGGWNNLDSFADGNLNNGDTYACYTLTSTNVTDLKTNGLIVTGYYITITKVELFSVSSENEIFSGSHALTSGELNLAYDNKGHLSETFMNDFICITYTCTAGSGEYDAFVEIDNPSGWAKFSDEARRSSSYGAGTRTFTYPVTNATILEAIQLTGVILQGNKVTVSKVELLKSSERKDYVPVTIGSDGIATFSTSSKRLDFTGTDIYPYYASEVAKGTVTLTKLDDQITYGWQGYILKGSAGTYDIPVTTADGTYPGANYLKPTGDYSKDVARSVEGTTYHYIFAKDGDNIGFYLLGSDYSETYTEDKVEKTRYAHRLAAHKAYLETETDLSADASTLSMFSRSYMRLSFGGGEGTTAINTALKNPIVEDGLYYTLQGVAVKNPSKGIYILNGKKVFVK